MTSLTATSRRRAADSRSSFGRLIKGRVSIDILLSFGFGVIFLSIMLVFAIFFPNPPPFQLKIFITTLALAAGGVGAMLPGLLEVQHKGIFRASGAAALVAIVLFFQPGLESAVVTFEEPPQSAEPAAEAYLAEVDSGSLAESWALLDPASHGNSPAARAQMDRIYATYRKPLGNALSRELVGVASMQSPPGSPVGLYRALSYRTRFAAAQGCRPEAVLLRATQDLTWRVFSHQIGPSAIDCGPV